MATCAARQGKRAKVILSNVTNVYKNLALEHWILNNWSFANFDCLLIYRNDPCVVIGRFQNTWREVNVDRAKRDGVSIARRVSGGGTVYHDLGNVNFSFFSDKPSHCPARNLQFLSQTLSERHMLSIDLNTRHDLHIGDRKISGSASRIIRTGSFHHCTLLVNSDLAALSGLLQGDTTVQGSSTASVPSPTTSLLSALSRDVTPRSRDVISAKHHDAITPPNIIDDVAEEYLSLYFESIPTEVDLWSEDCTQDTDNSVILVEEVPDKVVDHDHESWDWVFGRSPKFVRQFELDNYRTVSVSVERGLVKEVDGSENSKLVGTRYDPGVISRFLSELNMSKVS